MIESGPAGSMPMQPHDPTPNTDRSEPSAPPPPPPVEAVPEVPSEVPLIAAGPLRPERIWALVLGAGLLAGVGAWMAGEASLTAFKPELETVYGMGIARIQPSYQGQIRADT